MTLRTKIYGGYIAALLFCIVAAVYIFYQTALRDTLLDSISKTDFTKTHYVDKLGASFDHLQNKALLLSTISERKELIRESELAAKEILAIRRYCDSMTALVYISQFELNPKMLENATIRFFAAIAAATGVTDPASYEPIPYEKETRLIETIQNLTTVLSTKIEFEKRNTVQKDRKKAIKPMDEEIIPSIDSARHVLRNFEKVAVLHTLSKTETLSRFSELISVFTYVVFSFLIVLIIAAIFDVRKIMKSIEQITIATQSVGLGTFDRKLEIRNFAELNNLGNAFNRMIQQLEEVEKLKSDFFNKLVHDFKSPLDNIKQSCAVLAKDMAGATLTTQQKKFVDIIQRSAGELRNMVQNQLEESKLIAGQSTLTFQLTDLRELIKERIQLQRPTAIRKNINFFVKFTDADFQINCDAIKIRRVMDNLLSNAIRFSPTDSTISIEIEDQNDKTQVRIKDSGGGIPHELQPHIFQKYARQVNSDTASGTGLGLYTAKYIIELHGGQIWFKSKPGFGTTFYFALPKQKQI
ncbi:HAMP domain-containing histidine kinase [bacterium]|nr:MAG: HAMP domain-containing histidine kinase [bacterium]